MKGNVSYVILVLLLGASGIVQGVGMGTSSTAAVLPTVYVDPPKIIDRTGGMDPGNNFSVYVNVRNVTELYAWSFRMSFNPSILNVTTVELGTWFGDAAGAPAINLPISIRNDLGYMFCGQMLITFPEPPPHGANGTGNLATVNFLVVGTGVTTLELVRLHTALTHEDGTAMDREVEDGLFDNRPQVKPPTAVFDAEPLAAEVDETITFNASASNDEADGGWIVSYYWDFGDGENATGMVVTHVYVVDGNYTVTLTVTDNDDETDTATVDIAVGHDIEVTSVITSYTAVMPGVPVGINVTVANNRGFNETFDVTAYNDTTPIETRTVQNLKAGLTTSLAFTWDTTGTPIGDYTIMAVASNVTNEINTANNKNNCTITIAPFNLVTHSVEVGGFTFHVITKSTSIISDFNLVQAEKKISFSASGEDSVGGFCNTTIPKTLLWLENPHDDWLIWIDGESPLTMDVKENKTHTFLYFTYTHSFTTKQVQIIGTGVATPPVAVFTPSTTSPVVGATITFDASASDDPDGTIVSWDWNFGDEITDSGEIVEHAYTVAGIYTVTLTVTDNSSLSSDPAQEMVTVYALPVAFTYSPSKPKVDETINLNASASYVTPAGKIVRYEWNFDDGTIEIYVEGANLTAVTTHKYTSCGNYNVTLKITDSENHSNSTAKQIKVFQPPIVAFAYSPDTPVVGQTITFDASTSNDPDGNIISYAWNFGDGSSVVPDTDPTTNHTYSTSGPYVVTLTVTDNDTLTDVATQSVTIRKMTSTISIALSSASITVGENATIDGSINPIREGVTITISYRPLGGETWSTFTTQTDENSQYSYLWRPESAGTYEIKASWEGDENTLANETGIQELTVQEAGPNMVLVTAAATVTIVSIAAIVIYFMRARKQPSNSESHAEESPAKSKRKARIDKNIEVKVRKD